LFAKKFDDHGPRFDDIREAFSFAKKENPSVLELGCGNGRDAGEIANYTNDYLGIDISIELIKLAKEKFPLLRFEIRDIEDYEFPKNLDIIFAFASLLHSTKDSLKIVLEKSFNALHSGGIIYLSLKYSPTYQEVITNDEFGIRTFYYYSGNDIREIAGKFSILKNEIRDARGQTWLEVILQK
jgi:SAM-dependent methyltransferase